MTSMTSWTSDIQLERGFQRQNRRKISLRACLVIFVTFNLDTNYYYFEYDNVLPLINNICDNEHDVYKKDVHIYIYIYIYILINTQITLKMIQITLMIVTGVLIFQIKCI